MPKKRFSDKCEDNTTKFYRVSNAWLARATLTGRLMLRPTTTSLLLDLVGNFNLFDLKHCNFDPTFNSFIFR